MQLKEISSVYCHGGWLKRFTHQSEVTQCEMTFAVYFPPPSEDGQLPSTLYWLSGLTCTDENFSQKAGAFETAAKLGLVIVMPDTSPRGEDVPDDIDGAYDFGLGASFYLNATQAPWKKHYQMESYVLEELPNIIENNFDVNGKKSISGHSMGGHGAITLGLKYADQYHSISAFSPICNPMNCQWGRKAFSAYLGHDQELWVQYDSTELMKKISDSDSALALLVDQGLNDNFLNDQLKPESLEHAAKKVGYPLILRRHALYDHSYYFISTFISSHLEFHAKHLA